MDRYFVINHTNDNTMCDDCITDAVVQSSSQNRNIQFRTRQSHSQIRISFFGSYPYETRTMESLI